jgi:4-alpha-glucanotransferase
MQLIHKSRSPVFRRPYGAVPAGSKVRIALQVQPEESEIKGVYLAYAYGLYSFQSSRCRLAVVDAHMAAAEALDPGWQAYGTELRMPVESGLLFYWFEIDTGHGIVYLTRDRDNHLGGGVYAQNKPRWLPGEPHSPTAWQITIYNPAFHTPEWLSGAVIYQIFPDRFHRDAAFSADRFVKTNQPERIFHQDWHEDVDIAGKPETGYIASDFFGGSLNGIREKLPYINELGVTVIYLNPIFRARSNHRYDTGDYEKIDPLLGTEVDFVALCREAQQLGIRIILDGVFSHTGADSRYFNKFGRYPDIGAWQEATEGAPSPFGSWYGFHRKGDQLFYDSWWGFPDLPSVNEHDLTFRETITGEDGIARRWLRLGAAGWRLDVSDELPDGFLRELRQATRQEKPDSSLLGEVWEDASNKISYGSYRDFLLGNTHDHVMGYPFQQALIGWLSGHFAAERMHHLLETLREHYPPMAFSASFNLISSHDIMRAITALAGPPDPGNREIQANLFLTQDQRTHGEALLRLAVLFQMVYPGCPVIYYGDETGMEGYRDPFNRRTFPWGRENKDLQAWFGKLGRLRRDWPVLRNGTTRIYAHRDCVAIERTLDPQPAEDSADQSGPGHVLVAINRSYEARTMNLNGRTLHLQPTGWLFEADGKPADLGQY